MNQRYKLLLNYVAGPLLFLLLSWSVYHHISSRYTWQQVAEILDHAFARHNSLYLLCLVLLMVVNWTVEALKWKLAMSPVQTIPLFRACKAVFSGLSFSMFVPTAAGEYVGRTLYMHEGNRLRSLPLNIVGSISQLLVTLVAGTIGLFAMRSVLVVEGNGVAGLSVFWLDGLLYAILVAICVFLLVYFQISWFTKWFEKIPFVQKHRLLVQGLEAFDYALLTRILALSVLRYCVFIVQYIVVFQVFDVQIPLLQTISATTVLFLILAVIPSVPNIAELGVRGEVSRQLFGLLSANAVGIVFSAALIWIVNLILPAVAGSIFLIGIKIFRSKA